jgi:pimeloyl-ACP methyl ester carboxylesterase
VSAAASISPSSVVTTIPVGHHIHREAPEEFAAAALPHLALVADATV